MDTNNEILDAIEILTNKKIGENITKILTGICKSVDINNNTCVMDSNGVISTVQFYGNPPEVNELYRIFVPSNNMSRSFIVVPPKFTVNPNLLDNWYFVRPVNQRGQTKYTGSWVYTIDRWFLGGEPSNSMEITDGGIHVSYTMPGWNVIQKLKNVLCKGKTYTFSVIYKSTLPLRLVVSWGDNKYFYNESSPATNEWALATITGTVPADAEIAYEQVMFQLLGSVAGTIDIKATKLEIGSTQTLAHLGNGNWVLNEIPDYGEQLRKCQRYFLKIGDVVHYCSLGNGVARDDQFVSITISTPVTMRTVPGLVAVPAGFTMRHSDTIVSGGANFSVDAFSQNSILLKVQSQVALTPGDMWEAFLQPNGSLMFSADL